MTVLTKDQVKSIEERITQLSEKYIGKTLDSLETYPLIGEVRDALKEDYPDVRVHLSYTALTDSTSVEVSINDEKISVIFTSAPIANVLMC